MNSCLFPCVNWQRLLGLEEEDAKFLEYIIYRPYKAGGGGRKGSTGLGKLLSNFSKKSVGHQEIHWRFMGEFECVKWGPSFSRLKIRCLQCLGDFPQFWMLWAWCRTIFASKGNLRRP